MFEFNPQIHVGPMDHGIEYEHMNMLKIQIVNTVAKLFEIRQMGKVIQHCENI